MLITEGAHLDADLPGERRREIFDVDAGPAVDVRRIFLR